MAGERDPSEGFWDGLWKREGDFMASARREFRHETAFIGVSTIAEQYYCEFKVENEYAFGEVPTEAKTTGTELHDELIPGVEITADQFVRLVSRREPSFAVLNVWGTVGGLRIVGTPDHIIWSQGKPLWLVELKTTRGDPSVLWEDQLTQVRIYGLLLEQMGFDCSKLRLAVVRVRTSELTEEERSRWILSVSGSLMAERVRELESARGGSMKVHVVEHDRDRAQASIMAKRGYWTGEREPTSSTSIGKCRACEYSAKCMKSLVKSD